MRQGSVPKTSSGKVQRHACRRHYIDKSLLVVEQWSLLGNVASDETEEQPHEKNGQAVSGGTIDSEIAKIVVQQVKAVARERAKTIDMNTNIVVDLGLDSLERLEIARELENIFGGRFPDEVLQEVETIGEVTAAVEKYVGTKPMITPTAASEVVTPSKLEDGPIPESYFKIEKTPEYIRLQRTKDSLVDTGHRNPFFSVHEGRIGKHDQDRWTYADFLRKLQLPRFVGAPRSHQDGQRGDRRVWNQCLGQSYCFW